ncbi:DUF5704 domain-containing protein (plasmid) [Lysinibacillus sp. MHQ-1]|nr:DUF5704 domain-containing protein [Lysinibacillus sp. MHQ-1]
MLYRISIRGRRCLTKKSSLIQPSPSGSISSDSGEFDVVQGIPSSEYLRADAQSEEYLYEQDFVQKKGKTVFNNVNASKEFTLTWTTSKTDSKGNVTYTDHEENVTKKGCCKWYRKTVFLLGDHKVQHMETNAFRVHKLCFT